MGAEWVPAGVSRRGKEGLQSPRGDPRYAAGPAVNSVWGASAVLAAASGGLPLILASTRLFMVAGSSSRMESTLMEVTVWADSRSAAPARSSPVTWMRWPVVMPSYVSGSVEARTMAPESSSMLRLLQAAEAEGGG